MILSLLLYWKLLRDHYLNHLHLDQSVDLNYRRSVYVDVWLAVYLKLIVVVLDEAMTENDADDDDSGEVIDVLDADGRAGS